MHFFKVFSFFALTAASAVTAQPTMEKRYPVPLANAQPNAAPVEAPVMKRQDSSSSNTTDIASKIEEALPQLKTYIEKEASNLNLGNLGDIGSDLTNLVSGAKGLLNSSLLTNLEIIVNGAATLLGGDAPKIGNQLLSSKLINKLGEQSTYDTLVPLLKNAKPLLSQQFVNNTVNTINTVADVMNSITKLL